MKVAAVVRRTLPVVVTAPGHTDALEQQKIRAPFKGTLVRLGVADGDQVKAQQVVGELVAQDSEAALNGAEALLRNAQTEQQRADGLRAVELARRGLVRAPLRAPKAGVVVSHGADEGSLVSEGQDLIALAISSTVFFRADMLQTDLPRLRSGERASIRLAAAPEPLPGVVHGVLPAASPTDLTVPVRVDFTRGRPGRLGLFGTVAVLVEQRAEVLVVPASAVLRDDVSGVKRLARLTAEGRVRWMPVETGIESEGQIEVRGAGLEPGLSVIVSGQIGLADGARAEASP